MLQEFSRPIRLSSVSCCAILVCLLSFDCLAQTNRLPRAGTIKDYPATGLMTGCGNLYFYPAAKAKSSDTAYIFIARGDGSDAWMNLGGRDVRLRQIKSTTKEGRIPRQYYYRFGTLRVSVVIENFKPANASVEEGDSMFKMRITLRRRSAVRIVRAVGDSDC